MTGLGVLGMLVCARCTHAADLHGVEGMDSGCMVRAEGYCNCPLTWEAIEARAIRRMGAGLAINTEDDPDAEGRARQERENSEAQS